MSVWGKAWRWKWDDLHMAMVVARREIQDSFRDWRIIIPIILLTLAFPALMNFTAGRLLNFVRQYGAEILGNQLVPFLLLVVGFFPMSFSLVIALETFVGEKERKSLEPLLATPLTNTQLYLGKMLAALVPPLSASYLGIGVYLLGLRFTVGWVPTWQLFVQTVLLSTVQGVIMVAGAVVISSQTTSVRAANLLASFIIVPMALLIQGEAAAMFWGNHVGLWWLILALVITAVVLVRMGVRVFNREELMGREIDQLRLDLIWRAFWGRFTGRDENGRYPAPWHWYRDTFAIIGHLKPAIFTVSLALIMGALIGILLARQYIFPPHLQAELTGSQMVDNLSQLSIVIPALPGFIFMQNVRVLLLIALLGVFTFGVLGLLIFMLPWGVIGFMAAQIAFAGESASRFLLGTIIPHATLEIPALVLATAAALRWHVSVISPPPRYTLSQVFILAAADFGRVLVGIAIPLLILAAFVEAFVTPDVLFWVYGLTG
ncbi:MAG: hypothetical protein D6706_08235 [Chloroflexi bacterium]|nr:MAG: hypothetical protein D6706_08235 [Chloroflexota bacterium]